MRGGALRGLARVRTTLYGDRPPARAQLPPAIDVLAAAVLLALLAAGCYWPHIHHGGLMSDDWSNLADFTFAETPRYLETVRLEWEKLGARPLLAAVLPLPAALFGGDAGQQIAFGVGVATVTSLLGYVALRTAGLSRLLAFGAAALALILPASAAVRLWPAAALNHVAVCFLLIGLLCTMRAFSAHGRRATMLHLAGLVSYAASLAMYEVAAIVILLLAPLYLRFGAPNAVLRRASADTLLVVVLVSVSAVLTREVRDVAGPLARIADLPWMVVDPLRVLAATFTPFGIPDWVALLAIVLVLVAAVRQRAAEAQAGIPEVRDTALVLLGLLALVGAAIVPMLGTPLRPTAPGLDSRGNLLVGPLLSAAAVLAIALTAAYLSQSAGSRHRRAVRQGVTIAGIVWLLAGSWAVARSQQATWGSAAAEQQATLDALRANLPKPTPGSFIYTYGRRTEVAPRVPVFDESWDLWGAAAVLYDDPTLQAFPLRPESRLTCSDAGVVPVDPLRPDYAEYGGTRYGNAIAVDLARGAVTPILNHRACDVAARRVAHAASPRG